MTDEEIDALPAGSELDALIEKYVFRQQSASVHVDGCPYYMGGIDGNLLCPIENYSTSIFSAWPLVEMFKMTITPKSDPTSNSKWLADVRLCSSEEPWLAYGNTAPLAICRAALKAVERETAQGIWTVPLGLQDALRKNAIGKQHRTM